VDRAADMQHGLRDDECGEQCCPCDQLLLARAVPAPRIVVDVGREGGRHGVEVFCTRARRGGRWREDVLLRSDAGGEEREQECGQS